MENNRWRDGQKAIFLKSIVALVLPMISMSYSYADKTGGVTSALTNAENDVNTARANATVWLPGCTGTLIASDLVVTAGHCYHHGRRIGHNSGLVCTDPEVPGRWYPVEDRTQIKIGNNSRTPIFTTTAKEYTVPGCADIYLMRLSNPVPSSAAEPVKVLVSLGGKPGSQDADFLRGKSLVMAGWGVNRSNARPTLRKITSTNFKFEDKGKIFTESSSGSVITRGDSGGPLYWDTPSGERYLVAVTQGASGAKTVFTPTFRNGLYFEYKSGKKGNLPSVSDWFRKTAPHSVNCSEALPPPGGMLPVLSYYSPDRKDNLLTANPEYAGCRGTVRSPDYKFTRVEGFLFNPTLPQPKGTVKLYSWYSASRGDNFTTSEPAWIHWVGDGKKRSPDYRLSRLEGFIYDPAKPQPSGTIPLYRWYSRSRGDNHTTSAFPNEGRRGQRLQPDYGSPQKIGYIRNPR